VSLLPLKFKLEAKGKNLKIEVGELAKIRSGKKGAELGDI